MSVNLDPVLAVIAGDNSSPTPAPKSIPTAVSKSSATPVPLTPSSEPSAQPVPVGYLSPDVSFRRDANGQVYYVLTDSQSGKELREVPPATLRSVSQGIEDFLKEEETRASSHIEVKA